jgi:hypothetical protein
MQAPQASQRVSSNEGSIPSKATASYMQALMHAPQPVHRSVSRIGALRGKGRSDKMSGASLLEGSCAALLYRSWYNHFSVSFIFKFLLRNSGLLSFRSVEKQSPCQEAL